MVTGFPEGQLYADGAEVFADGDFYADGAELFGEGLAPDEMIAGVALGAELSGDPEAYEWADATMARYGDAPTQRAALRAARDAEPYQGLRRLFARALARVLAVPPHLAKRPAIRPRPPRWGRRGTSRATCARPARAGPHSSDPDLASPAEAGRLGVPEGRVA